MGRSNRISSNGSPTRPDELKCNVDVKSEPLAPIFIKIEKGMDVIHVLHAYALKLKLGLLILSALGFVRKVILPMGSKKTYDEGVYQIMSLSGRIIPLKTGEIDGEINLVMSDAHGATVGGIVQNLVAETTVEVIVCPSYYDPSRSHPFYFHPPLIFGNPFLPSSIDQCASNQSSSERTSSQTSSIKPTSNHPSSNEPSSSESSSMDASSIHASSIDASSIHASSIDVSSTDSDSSDPNSSDRNSSDSNSSDSMSRDPSL
ncbi:unnamed protein product [Arabis nemorensis]|uniref:AT-hook motif nuclear-localized protein n=1 Tax=Arabis nemorensis TaxID=586526 RepID=A0A565CEC7_9BRAS|nr:unnamed protein product [Arabis nemorensis]